MLAFNPRRQISYRSSSGRWAQQKCAYNLHILTRAMCLPEMDMQSKVNLVKSVQWIWEQISTFAPSWVGHSCHFLKFEVAPISSVTAACSPLCRPGTHGRGPPQRAAGDTKKSQRVTITGGQGTGDRGNCTGNAINSRLFLFCPARVFASSCCCRCRPHISDRSET